ncbi:zinc-dependent peptidase [Ideonella sp. 4Y16]|uniref:M90 family metallopeptidase n=1 Tax=Ideonella alba TaxID=2824118 RepID=UPI001B3797BE|nr:M90 family metallopeptidase [Ideonella alba]MBQ0942350.1 zinc-dependent peptidase [Ideonella alba]
MGWLSRLAEWREQRQLARHAIDERLWQAVLQAYPFIAERSEADRTALRRLCSLFLARKQFHGAQGLVIDDLMAVCIAAQACLPVLGLSLDHYDDFVGIVVQPDEVLAPRTVTDEDGVVHEYAEALTGEAMEGGPVMLSWHDVAHAGAQADLVYNVVIHEFAHVLDMRDGVADGVPLLPTAAERQAWVEVLEAEFEDFVRRVDAGEDTLIDPYGAEAPEEFFAVASEAFFVAAADLRDEHPRLYRLLAGYYRQDPAVG